MRISQERKPKGSRKRVRLVEAVILGLLALWLAWEAPSPARGGLVLMLLALALAVPTGFLLRSWWRRTPFDISSRLPLKLRVRARVCWMERVFLGWTESFFGGPRFAVGLSEDSVGIVGPPRVNKSAGIAIPQVLMWGGPLISIAPKPELFRWTARRRRELAQVQGGRVLIYSPTSMGRVEGLQPVRFSPSGTVDANEITLRVNSWTDAAATGKKVEDADHWKEGAKRLLRGLFLASAHHPQRPGDFALVHGWLTAGLAAAGPADHPLLEPIRILRELSILKGDKYAADLWAEELEGVLGMAGNERRSFYSAAMTTIAAVGNPAVLRSTEATDFDPEEFLLSGSSLYVVSDTEHQRAVAPLISMVVQSIIHSAYRLHRAGRLPHRLLVSLDDLANVAPLPQLESIVSQGGGQGVNVAWNLQSLAQLRDAYSADQAEAIWSATRCRVIFGGLTDEGSLERFSSAMGEERVVAPGESDTEKGRRGSKHVSWRRLLAPGQLRAIPDGWAVLLYHNLPILMLREPLAVKRPQVSRHMVPWAVAETELEAATQPAAEV